MSKLTYKQRYNGSPRQQTMQHMRDAIDAQCGPAWAAAFERCQVTRGKWIGLIKANKPSNDDLAGLVWECYNHSRGAKEAARFGLVAYMPIHGLIGSMMFCRVPEGNKSAADAEKIISGLFTSIYWKGYK